MKLLLLKSIIVVSVICFTLSSANYIKAQQSNAPVLTEETLEAKITTIISEKEIVIMDKKQLQQEVELLITKGSLKGKTITVISGDLPMANIQKYNTGDQVTVSYSKNPDGSETIYITDYIRRRSLLILFGIFIIITLLITKWQGLTSLIGMFMSFAVIFTFILPKISAGKDPVTTAITGSLFIIPVTFYLSHGLNKKTTVAVISTIISLIITGILAAVFIETAKLTGFSSEEASFLQVINPGMIHMKGLLLAGIIIGSLGIFDDITISQAAIVFELKKANHSLNIGQLYMKAMNVGKDHISSLVNTLVLVYAGAATPLLLLFMNNSKSFSEVVNYEIIAEEMVRTMVGSIGLILAVPITTILASFILGSSSGKNCS
ncbi:MAG: YibE/F family protein [Bacteroidetes bacterium]|nr:MAG: YibE/F family protein [Bacteroidota bacterium]